MQAGLRHAGGFPSGFDETAPGRPRAILRAAFLSRSKFRCVDVGKHAVSTPLLKRDFFSFSDYVAGQARRFVPKDRAAKAGLIVESQAVVIPDPAEQ